MYKQSIKLIFSLCFTFLVSIYTYGQDIPKKNKPIPIEEDIAPKTIPKDSIKTTVALKKPDTIPIDSVNVKQDTLIKKKEYLTDIINRKSKDYESINLKEKKIYLYNESEIVYGDIEIKSGIIIIDYDKNVVYAKGILDSVGTYTQNPVFKQGGDIIEPDSIKYNYKTKKALVYNSRTEQSGGYIMAPITKKENDSTYYVKNAKYTTAENQEDPEYYFLIRKGKVVPSKKVVTGVTNMYIYDVPTPIGIPFGYFPLTEKQTSGVIFPSFGEQNERGYFLQNGGYYFAISDYLDLTILGDYYTNGSYGNRIESDYAVRYKYRGNLSFRYENLISSEKGFPDYSKTSVYNIRWSHSQGAKANPNSRFSASVNLGSSRYYQESVNQLNTSNFLNNTLSSSITYSKTIPGEPELNINLTGTHSQNTNTETINMTLPTFQGSMSRIFPFEPKSGTKKGVLQNINFQYNVRGENRIQTTDSLFFKKEMFDEAKMGFKHSIPISTNFKVFKYFSLTASTSFEENWVFKTINKYYDTTTSETITEEINGFDSFRTYNFGTSVGTTIYGQFNFKKEGKTPKIEAFRHVMRPSISYNINPAFDEYYDSYEVIDADGTTREEYSRFEQSLYGAPGKVFSSSLGFSLGNNFEAKIRSKDSTDTTPKKIPILNNLNFSTSYNLAGDSLQWSPLRMSGGTQLLDNKLNINFGATLDPYALDNNNRKIEKFNINNGGSLFRLTTANITMGYNLSSSNFSGNSSSDNAAVNESLRSGGRADDLFGKPQDFADQRLNQKDKNPKDDTPKEFYNYKVPWSLRLAYAVNYSNATRQNEISSHSLMFSGDIELSPKWNIGVSSGYDLKNKGFTFTQFRFERDLLSWRMNFSWVPFGNQSSWNFFIGIQSSILEDIKYDKNRQPDKKL